MILIIKEKCSESETSTRITTMATSIATAPNTINRNIQEFVQEAIVKCADGSIYKGGLDRFGNRAGFGTYRTPIMLFGVYDPQNTASLVNWREYTGEWENDAASGFGIMRRYRGDGTCTVEYEGQWLNGHKVTKAKQD